MDTVGYDLIGLEEMDKVCLMNRIDTKFWFHRRSLAEMFHSIQPNYFILSINGITELPYLTEYFDTLSDSMYIAHHNGKLNRYKIRRRSYVSSGISFLEVKFSNNKGRTIKRRVITPLNQHGFNEAEDAFLRQYTPFSVADLVPSLTNEFLRVTLVNKNYTERCTVDFNLHFETSSNQKHLSELVIVEIKSDGVPVNSPLSLFMRDQRIKASGFSKYCIGRAYTDSYLKKNAFKQKMRMIEKTCAANLV
jgi:VTC domain.